MLKVGKLKLNELTSKYFQCFKCFLLKFKFLTVLTLIKNNFNYECLISNIKLNKTRKYNQKIPNINK